jgi:glycosyltransferase involved in cell wall biosynthesis
MRIALVVPPFICVPPKRYGGTELFAAELAEGLKALGHHPVVYTVGESKVDCEVRWRRERGAWPISSPIESSLEDVDHSSWACQDAAADCDIIHLNNAPGLSFSRFVPVPMVYTLHHPREESLSRYYTAFPAVHFTSISRNQARAERPLRTTVIHHGIRLERYRVATGPRPYLCFIGRIAPVKGAHTAVAVARAAGMPLKIAGEIQPQFRGYWEAEIRPQLGNGIEYVGEVDLRGKNELLAGARALLFPIEWEEPFGLVMIEAMACGVPVLAFARGSAPEVVTDRVSGWICADVAAMARRAAEPGIPPESCRAEAERRFCVQRMVKRYLEVYRQAASPSSGAQPPAAGRKRSAAILLAS